MIPKYEKKFNYLLRKQGGVCAICGRSLWDAYKKDLHHRCHNTKSNRAKYPFFINSLLNLQVVHNHCNTTKLAANKITDYQAWRIEAFLARHPRLNGLVNFF